MLNLLSVKRAVLSSAVVGAIILAAPATFAQSKPAGASSMSGVETNKARFRMFYDEVVNKKNMTAFDELMDTSFKEHQVSPGYTDDYAGVKKFFTDMFTAFPDLKATIDIMVAEGDLVTAQATWSGTQKGPFMGAPASGKTVTFKTVDIIRIKNGKAVEHWGVTEDLAIMTQLGLIHAGH